MGLVDLAGLLRPELLWHLEDLWLLVNQSLPQHLAHQDVLSHLGNLEVRWDLPHLVLPGVLYYLWDRSVLEDLWHLERQDVL